MSELRELGCSEADIQSAFAARIAPPAPDEVDAQEPDLFEVWPQNEPALQVFLAMETQWRFHPTSGQHVGLRIDALNQVIEDLLQEHPPAVLVKAVDLRKAVRTMERAALDEMAVLRATESED